MLEVGDGGAACGLLLGLRMPGRVRVQAAPPTQNRATRQSAASPAPSPPHSQYKPMRAVRFIIAGSIEERILKLQEKKQLIFEGTVGQDNAALARLTEDDLRFLFG